VQDDFGVIGVRSKRSVVGQSHTRLTEGRLDGVRDQAIGVVDTLSGRPRGDLAAS